ncbi:MAG: hypothetical protein QOD39_1227 [Mycobacterium sp.]|nr:hypothetical protein [Mycobacterium sp.]
MVRLIQDPLWWSAHQTSVPTAEAAFGRPRTRLQSDRALWYRRAVRAVNPMNATRAVRVIDGHTPRAMRDKARRVTQEA